MMTTMMMMIMMLTYLSSLLVQVTNLAAKISPLTLCRHFITRPNFPLIMILMNLRILLTIVIIMIMIIVTDRAQLVGLFYYRAGSCHVLGKKSGSGQVQLEMLKYSIRYLIWVFPGMSGISEYFGYFRVFWVFKLYLMFGCTQNDRYARNFRLPNTQ